MINAGCISEIRNSINDASKSICNRVRIAGGEIEVVFHRPRGLNTVRIKVLKTSATKAVVRFVHSGYDMNGNYFTRKSERVLPAEEFNELFYSINQH